ncbi:cytokine receptor-like [Epargyreus clarus]|uniref:cytokine receptor-like n=1 Tax=Epargyreus clarus TaxID=520877 RepID=UPI003C2DA884
MANNCLDTRYRRTKCSDSRKGPLRSWVWCILIKCFIGLPCIFSKCLGLNTTVAMYPETDIAIRYGDPLEIYCIAEDNYTSVDLEFTVNGKTLESEMINETTIRFYKQNPEKQLKVYYCRNKKTAKKCVKRVLVEAPPDDVTDFKCISKNLETLICSWPYPKTNSIVNYTLTFAINGNSVHPLCKAKEGTDIRYCTWDQSSLPRYRQQEETQYFKMTACNVFGCNRQNFTVDHFSIVKPEPPANLKVVKIGPHSIVLKWNVPNNMFDLVTCGLDHIIEYQIAKIDNTTYFHRVDSSSLPPKNKTYKFQLSNLPYAYMQYEVRISIKTKKAVEREFWSDFSFVMFYTASERPNRPPEMIAGAFEISVWEGKRIIYVYWKQLQEYEEAGANFTYKVLYSQGNKTFPVIFPDKNKSLSYVVLNDVSLEALHVRVWSFNSNGSSVNNSEMYIPSEKERNTLSLTSFTKLAYENGTYELSWVGIKNIDNYTLFWCHYNATRICSGRMDFAVIDAKKNNHIIDLPKEYRYQFAISANNGTSTSGMVWAKCDISKDGFAMYRFPAELKYDAPGKSSVNLSWSMNCALQKGIITGYNISYCPIVQTSSVCDESIENKYKYISDPKQMTVLIEGLHSFRTYQFTLSLNTIYGQKNIENATARITTSEDTPTSPINVGVSDIRNDSLVLSWDPPLQRNGLIGKYVIYNYDIEHYVDWVSGTDKTGQDRRRQITLTGLQAFRNYSFTVQACNTAIGMCSKPDPKVGILVRTRIGRPGILTAPTITSDGLKWETAIIPGGTVDAYQVRRIRDDKPSEVFNTSELSYTFSHCEGSVSIETYQVRAINFDTDLNYGVIGIGNVTLPIRSKNDTKDVYYGEWSQPSTMSCRNRGGLTMTFIFLGIFFIIGLIYGSIKLYKRYRKMEDIKPVLPNGLGVPEKDLSKYTFAGWNPTNKDEKPSSDEMLLLPNSKTTVTPPENKQKDNNCAASDHTDSTALSDSSRGAVDRQASTSDDGSNSSLHLEVEPVRTDDSNGAQEKDTSNADSDNSPENSLHFPKAFTKNPASGYVQPVVNPNAFTKNPASGYVQQVVKPATGYVQSAPSPVKSSPSTTSSQPAGSSYVMAALSPPIFTTGVTQPPMANPPKSSSEYVLPAEAQARSMMNFPKIGTSSTKVLGPESLPTMPTLPPPTKHGADSSYIQLQSLDALPSLKPQVRNTVPLKPPISSGYVSPGDVVINKHLNNMLSGSQLADESAILDPTMSPDAYCRFSWSTDPVNDNLHSLLADSTTRTSSKN